ncbi:MULTISPECIES: membrane protein insertase YidC [unclassified Leeuwenhoekiella]|uniref:membrane protein insertase YidC n=1 Tax=unclassified Leeuwenhoekiella TaxID=2615029 RepID=UPI000C3B4762|nr:MULTISPECIES: membrane protein insertase YidC [unclassified Leeuwenhoekiella]MAW96704.1 membrane protein insertase YidC [Leeuwenhoekiella sp.]MBA81593.1 membrane protein insertase YidC [Leeuwenhoekiella sp.]|tara:strand:- start:57026 stop:58888 length:1863 start_codon:yes stop_codon:yes gene_type:complete
MEEKKFDKQSMIGFLLIGAILLFMLWQNQPTPEELEAEKAKEEQVDAEQRETAITPVDNTMPDTETGNDSLALERYKATLGSFAYSATLPSATDEITEIENEVLALKVSNKGGFITEAKLKNYKSYDSVPVYLIKDGNTRFNLNFSTTDNRTLNSENLYFEPKLTTEGENQVLSMKLKVSDSEYLEYRYTLKPDDYMMGFGIKTVGLQNVVNTSQPLNLDWELKGYRHAKSITYENRYTRLTYEYEGGDHDKLSQSGDDDAIETDVDWFNFRQHFFSSILLTDQPFEQVTFKSQNLVEDEEVDTVFTKKYAANIQLKPVNGELNNAMNFYFGPTDYQVLNSYDRGLDEAMPLGWGIFGWINKYLIIPFFNILVAYFPAGIAIILLTVSIKLLLSPVQYKQYLSQAKMKVLRPEINEINEKYADNPMKKQQETMKLYSKAGASPLSGCIPGLLQIPVFYALFTFFPSAFVLRQKSFLWADDLSSYDKIADLPFHIPFYGDHVSLFPILASIAIFIYMTMTTGQTMQQTSQPGMPNMKFLMYLSPIMMLFFFNNYASGLSLYYFVSNLITIGIMLVIKNFILDEQRIHAKIETAKAKPKKQNRFSKKFSEMMEQAEKQQKNK